MSENRTGDSLAPLARAALIDRINWAFKKAGDADIVGTLNSDSLHTINFISGSIAPNTVRTRWGINTRAITTTIFRFMDQIDESIATVHYRAWYYDNKPVYLNPTEFELGQLRHVSNSSQDDASTVEMIDKTAFTIHDTGAAELEATKYPASFLLPRDIFQIDLSSFENDLSTDI